MKKRWLTGILAAVMALTMCLAFGACGSSTSSGGDSGGGETEAPTEAAIKSETYDTTVFKVEVPEGWIAIPSSDLFDDYEGDYDPTTLYVCKGGDEETAMLTHPFISFNYYDPNTSLFDSRDFYDDVKDIDPMTFGDRTWTGYTCTSMDYPYTILTTGEEGADRFQANVCMENGGIKIAMDDADVQLIMSSVTVD